MTKEEAARIAAKIIAGLVGSAIIGYVYKGDKLVQEAIEAHFAKLKAGQIES